MTPPRRGHHRAPEALETLKKAARCMGVLRIRTRPSNRKVRVLAAGEPIAESDKAVELE